MTTRVWESDVLDISIEDLWRVVRELDLAVLTPSSVVSCQVIGKAADIVGSNRVVTYKTGDVWTFKILEISDLEHKISWHVETVEPAVSFSGRTDSFVLHRVSDSGKAQTFIEWISEFSSDASLSVTEDCRYKKKEAFKEMATSLAGIKWPADKVRRTYIEYFKKQGHTFWPSSAVVPREDPTLLFTNAGMNQFKPLFLGQIDPASPMAPLKRAANSQKCIRAGGKHNDLEDVGKDVYHHTYFEMLGNWSFGDYFKEESIGWAWELLTVVYGLDPTRLYATYFGGDVKDGVPADDDAKRIWLKYLPAERVLPFGKKENFWEMGEVGPCGPCTEIHYDRIGGRDASKQVNCEPGDPMVIEIWNLVFIQFNRKVSGELEALPAAHVDTGMGFERLTSVLQQKTSNYDTDVFSPILKKIQAVSGARPYTGKVGAEDVDHVDMAYRVLADHIRTLTFSITDGAVPGPNGRGYVLRRVLRRAVRYGQQILGAPEGFFHTIVPTVVDHFKGFFPELVDRMAFVMEIIEEEEVSFNRTLRAGIKRFTTEADALVASGKKMFPGETAFFLYGTMGFPVDLTELMAEEKGLALDRKRFAEVLEEDKEMARLANKTNYAGRELILEAGPISALKDRGVPATNDEAKYIWHKNVHSKVAAIYTAAGFVDSVSASTETIGVILEKTNFYSVSGGQVTDLGSLIATGGTFSVSNAQTFGGFVEHMGTVTAGSLKVGNEVELNVDYDHRSLIAPNHTMTHVLNYALRKYVGDHCEQKGSLVDDQKLRFDFNNKEGVSTEALAKIEAEVNAQIEAALPVHTLVVPLAKARAISSLRCVFGDTYPDPVRVVAVGKNVEDLVKDPENEAWNAFSVEFCAGTHLTNTAQAKKFKVVSEGSIAKGIRRVVCYTGLAAVECEVNANAMEARISLARGLTNAEKLSVEINGIRDGLAAIPMSAVDKALFATQLKELEKQLGSLRKEAKDKEAKVAIEEAMRLVGGSVVVGLIHCGNNTSALANAAQALLDAGALAVLLGSADEAEGKCAIVAAITEEKAKALTATDWLKHVLPLVEGKGGGKPTLAQGQGVSVSKLAEALAAGKAAAAGKY